MVHIYVNYNYCNNITNNYIDEKYMIRKNSICSSMYHENYYRYEEIC